MQQAGTHGWGSRRLSIHRPRRSVLAGSSAARNPCAVGPRPDDGVTDVTLRCWARSVVLEMRGLRGTAREIHASRRCSGAAVHDLRPAGIPASLACANRGSRHRRADRWCARPLSSANTHPASRARRASSISRGPAGRDRRRNLDEPTPLRAPPCAKTGVPVGGGDARAGTPVDRTPRLRQ
jgi:hypothetical protein